jgi:AraC family transcriptional regulator
MPYERRTLFESKLVAMEQVTLRAAAPAWSDEYEVASLRLLLPMTHSFECRLGAGNWTCDPRVALWLSPQQRYRLRRPWPRQSSLLLTLRDAEGCAGRREISPAARAGLALLRSRWRLGQAARLEMEEGLLAFARALRRDVAEALLPPHPAVERAREFLAFRFAESDSLAAIAQASHCSPYHLARVFRAHTGTSLHGYRTQLRMLRALERLEDGERDLSALAADLGYSSHAHFTAVFTKAFAMGPAQIRRNLVAAGTPA